MNVSFPKCNQAGTEFVISTTDDLQEKVNYLSEDFPISIFTQTYHHAARDSTPFHWHNELQLNWFSRESWNIASTVILSGCPGIRFFW